MMTTLLLYAYATGVFSSRGIENATVEDVAFRLLSGNEHPHFTTINQFRATHREALAGLFQQVLEACMSAGLVKLGHVAIDGTKMKANASKHKAMSYDRMDKDEVRLRAEVEALLSKAEAVDAAEDEADGAYDPQAEIRRREERIAKMAEVREALRRETAAKRAQRLEEQADELREKALDPATRPRDKRASRRSQRAANGRPPRSNPSRTTRRIRRRLRRRSAAQHAAIDQDGEPKPKAQRNFTDPQSRIMMRDGAFMQAYNGQIAVDEAHQIIVAAALSNQAPDTEYFEPMLRRVVENCDAVPECVTGDTGYFSAANVRAAEAMGSEPFIAVGGHRRNGFPDDESKLPQFRPRRKPRCAPSSRPDADSSVRSTQSDRRAGLRPDQILPRLSAVVVSRPLQEPLRMAPRLRHAQPAEAVAGDGGKATDSWRSRPDFRSQTGRKSRARRRVSRGPTHYRLLALRLEDALERIAGGAAASAS